MTKILFVDNGISFDSVLIKEKPFGGAEVAFVSLVENLSKHDYEVVVYNNCKNQGKINGVQWKRLDDSIYKEKCDVLVVNRGDKFLNIHKNCKSKIFWIHNPAKYLLKFRYLSKLFFRDFKIVFSSNYHLNTYPRWAPAKERIVIPYGIEEKLLNYKKKSLTPDKKAIFTSNPLRGLDWLLNMWEKNIHKNSKDSVLEIYSGSQTYGDFGRKHSNEINKILQKAENLKKLNVIIKQPLPREKLFKKIKKSRVFLYQGSIDETFCMAVSEAQMFGIPSVVMNYGCMNERIINSKTGYVCNNETTFCENTLRLLNNDNLWKKIHNETLKKKNYYTWKEIVEKWKKILN